MQFFLEGGGGGGDSRSKGVRARCKGDVQMVNVIAPKESNKFYSKIPNNQITNSSTFLTWFISYRSNVCSKHFPVTKQLKLLQS